jgi:hypothetical protein
MNRLHWPSVLVWFVVPAAFCGAVLFLVLWWTATPPPR